jgi:hypothetical protein
MNYFQNKILMFIIFIGIGFALYSKIEILNKKIDELKIENKKTQQNFNAYQDSINQVPDSIQIYNVFVRDLNYINKQLQQEKIISKNKITLLENKITILLDSIRFEKQKIPPIVYYDGTDSTIYQIPIIEENDFMKVIGKANFFMKTKLGDYNLKFYPKPLQVQNFLTFDKKDFSVVAITKINNKTVLSNTIISDELYTALIKPSKNNKIFNFGIGCFVKTNDFNKWIIEPEIYTRVEFININLKLSLLYSNKEIYNKIGLSWEF